MGFFDQKKTETNTAPATTPAPAASPSPAAYDWNAARQRSKENQERREQFSGVEFLPSTTNSYVVAIRKYTHEAYGRFAGYQVEFEIRERKADKEIAPGSAEVGGRYKYGFNTIPPVTVRDGKAETLHFLKEKSATEHLEFLAACAGQDAQDPQFDPNGTIEKLAASNEALANATGNDELRIVVHTRTYKTKTQKLAFETTFKPYSE